MTALLRRQAVIDKYAEIIGRNIYSQSLRDYCYKAYKDGNYYSDCSSSICYAYQQAGQGGNTMGSGFSFTMERSLTFKPMIKFAYAANGWSGCIKRIYI
jgi:hypothetical protein